MSRSIKYSTCPAAAILLAALLCACRPELEPSSAAAFLPPGRGGVSVSMPALSPALAKALGLVPTAKAAAKTESAVPRTYLDQVNYVTANPQGTLLADPGADFRIEVEIYNTFVSNTVPVCSGVSEPFAITAGNLTEVAVTCVPISATALEVGTESSAIELEPGLYDCDNYSFVTGGEAWYSFVATSTSMEVITALGYIVTFATAEGNPVAGDGSIVPAMDILTGDPPVFSSRIVTMIGQTYYLGVMSMDFKITGDVYVPAGNLRIMVTPAPSATPTPAPSATPTPEPSASPEPMPSPSPIPTP
jgi:hypothetical protein